MPDMVARRRTSITADEEERMRRGYELKVHYQMSQAARRYRVQAGDQTAFHLTYEHNGRVIVVNQGPRQAGEQERQPGFTYCRACNCWLVGDKAIHEHTGDEGKCPRHATPTDVLGGIHLFADSQNDVLTLDCPLPDDVSDAESFYTTLLHTFKQAVVLSMNLDESEIGGFLAKMPDEEERQRLVLYETAEGGTGAIKALTNPHRLLAALHSARELLHEGEARCDKACYECLCSFYNQRDHEWLDRRLVLPWLRSLEGLAVEPLPSPTGPSLEELEAACQSDLERQVLRAIQQRGLPLPDAAQKTIYHGDEPIASADFYYAPKHLIFVDGSPHYRDYVAAADEAKRRRLRAGGYRVLAITGDRVDESLDELAQRLGAR